MSINRQIAQIKAIDALQSIMLTTDLRIGQIIMNINRDPMRLFYMTDENMADALVEMATLYERGEHDVREPELQDEKGPA